MTKKPWEQEPGENKTWADIAHEHPHASWDPSVPPAGQWRCDDCELTFIPKPIFGYMLDDLGARISSLERAIYDALAHMQRGMYSTAHRDLAAVLPTACSHPDHDHGSSS